MCIWGFDYVCIHLCMYVCVCVHERQRTDLSQLPKHIHVSKATGYCNEQQVFMTELLSDSYKQIQ